MKRFSIFAFAAVAMLFVGCTKDIDTDIKVNDGIVRGELVTKTLVFEDSRVERDEVSGKLSWSKGDQVKVVLLNEGKYTLDPTAYTIDHTTGTVTIPDNAAYMVYPANLTSLSLSGTTLSFRLAHVMTAASTQTIFDVCPMKGTIDGDFVEFKNLMAFAKFPVTGTGKLKSAVLRTTCRTTSEFQPISNSATLDLTADVTNGGGVKMAANAGAGAFTWMRQNFSGNGIDLSTNPSLYFPVPAGEYENMGLVLVTDNGSHTIYANNKHTFTRSKVKPVSANPINLAAHKPANPVSLAGTTGKIAEDYASCYIVPPTAGSYGFPCILVDGTELKGGVTAEIKWAEEAGMVYDLFYDPSENSISFKTNGKEGNALIVLTDNTADGNTIVWSWHLWITDAPKTLSVKGTGSNSGVTYYLMDRVVGATWSPASTIAETSKLAIGSANISMNNTLSGENASDACGVYFQYQNRTPYPRIKSLAHIGHEDISTMVNSRCDVMYGFSQYAQHWAKSSSCGTVSLDAHGNGQYIHKSITLPNYQYSNNNAWVLSNLINNQNKTSNSVLVSEGNYRFWNSVNDNTHDVMMTGKTTHDPCPPGYIMENYSIIFWYLTTRTKEFGYTRAAEDNATYQSGFKFYGMYYNAAVDSKGNNVPLYWPCAGNRSDCTNGVSGKYGNCGYIYIVNTNNTNTYKGGTDSATTIGNGGAVAYGEIGDSYTVPALASGSPSKTVNHQAYPVRCRRGKF